PKDKKGNASNGKNKQSRNRRKNKTKHGACENDNQMYSMTSDDLKVTKQNIENFNGSLHDAFVAANNQGYIPAQIDRMINAKGQAKISWRMVLAKYIVRSAKTDYKWLPPNSKYLHCDLILPSNRVKKLYLAIAIDTSGSINKKQLNEFITEINGIVGQFTSYHIFVMSCDAQIHDLLEYDTYNPIKPGEILKLRGGGGTDFRPVFRLLNKKYEKPDCLIYMTDGYGTFPNRAPRYPVIWLLNTNIVPPWGVSVYIV
ncbi:MAG: hypothetical protein GF364_04935, partial [Candidatus Lokiarchaeota archaeon]|nr:hypothetical protein [Candidatus Lokiarchaeota archaeon]